MHVHEFQTKWLSVVADPRSGVEWSKAQEHFIDLCRMLGQPTPAEYDPSGNVYAFEKGLKQAGGGQGFADVWFLSHFAWEYKGPQANLDAAYKQLLMYKDDLKNPPLLVVCDLNRFQVHTNFTGTVKKVHEFKLADLHLAFWAAYGWPEPPEETDDEAILARLLALNLEWAGASS